MGIVWLDSDSEKDFRLSLSESVRQSPIPDHEMADNLRLYMPRQGLARVLFLDEVYRAILDVPGVIAQFGVRWGGDIATFLNLRGIHEPYNYGRHVFCFDTFAGFPSVHERDGAGYGIGDYGVPEGYEGDLAPMLQAHDRNSPVGHVDKVHIYKGLAEEQVERFLKEWPGAPIALAYLDMDLYEPTRDVLQAIAPRLVPGSVVVFDELMHPAFPGEFQALQETLGARNLEMRRSPYSTVAAYGVVPRNS